MTIEVLQQRGQAATHTARILGVTEGTVRYHRRRARDEAVDGRQKRSRIEALGLAEVVAHWWQTQTGAACDDRPPNVQGLHEFLQAEYAYDGSYKSVRKYVWAHFEPPRIRPFRRVETPPGAQTQSDWGEFRRVELGDPAGPTTLDAFVMVLSHCRKAAPWSGAGRLTNWPGTASTTSALPPAGRRGCCQPDRQPQDRDRPGLRRLGPGQPAVPDLCQDPGLSRRRLRGSRSRTEGEDGATGGREERLAVHRRSFDGLTALQSWTDTTLEADAARRICPATGRTVAASWVAERPFLRPLPTSLPEPFDLVRTAPVHKDCSVRFEGRCYVVPFTDVGRAVEVRGCSETVQVLDPQTGIVSVSYPRHTPERILIDPACYQGPGTEQVIAPKPLGRMARKLQEIAALPVEQRPVDLYAALAEVAR